MNSKDFVKITKILVGEDMNSYFEDCIIPTDDLKPLGNYSKAYEVNSLYFRNSLKDTYDFHPAPQKRYIIYLYGKGEITVSSGQTRIFSAGDILLFEDTYGKGHKSSIIEEGVTLIIT